MNNILVSIIVPIYNVKDYLEKCINSLCAQTHNNIEIILVDDGSTDGSSDICDEYAKKDKRIRTIHKENGGITSARKAGIGVAHGEYVGFVDGDDWIESNMYEALLEYAIENNSEIVLSDMYRHKYDGKMTVWSGADLSEGIYDMREKGELIARHLISGISSENKGINGSLNVKLFRIGMVRERIGIINDKLCGFADDKVITYAVILASKKIYVVHKAYYHGVDREDSATHAKNEKIFEQLQLVYEYLKEVFQQYSSEAILMEQLFRFLMFSSISNINRLAKRNIVPEYYFPNMDLLKDKNIVLYGAGRVGEAYYRQFEQTRIGTVKLWVDKKVKGKNISKVTEIKLVSYDWIVIAVLEKAVFESIYEELCMLGVEKDKILWKEPKRIIEDIQF